MRSLNIRCSQSEEGVDLAIFGDITRDKGTEILTALNYFKGQPITLSIYSGGGDVFASMGIRDRLTQENVTARVYGIAASGAAIILTGAKRVEMTPFSSLMIHRAYREDEQGNISQDKNTDRFNAQQVELFAKRTGKRRDVVEKWLANGDTFFSADEAIAAGLADGIYEPLPMAASLNNMKPMSEIIQEAGIIDDTTGEAVTQAEVAEAVESAETTEPTEQTEVEVEIPITPIEAVKAGLHGSFKAKVKVDVSANYAGIVASMAEELKSYKAQLDEANAQVETLTEKAAEVDAAKQAEADAKAAAEAAQAEVQKLKETPVEEAIVSNADGTVVKPGDAAVAGPAKTDIEKQLEQSNNAFEAALRRRGNN